MGCWEYTSGVEVVIAAGAGDNDHVDDDGRVAVTAGDDDMKVVINTLDVAGVDTSIGDVVIGVDDEVT